MGQLLFWIKETGKDGIFLFLLSKKRKISLCLLLWDRVAVNGTLPCEPSSTGFRQKFFLTATLIATSVENYGIPGVCVELVHELMGVPGSNTWQFERMYARFQ